MAIFKKAAKSPQRAEAVSSETGASAFIPFLVSWNVTKRCNLKCAHCYLDAGELEGADETTTNEAKRFVDEIASVNPEAMLILTGGEPLLRPDWPEIARYASGAGLTVVLGTNGTLLDDPTVKEIVKSGVKGVGISLDSSSPVYHDSFRGIKGAWEKTVAGIESLKRHGLDFQVQLTVTRDNASCIPDLIEFAHKAGARAVNVFFLVCTGRGQRMTDLKPDEYERTLNLLAKAEKEFEGRIMVRARCAPHFLRVASESSPESSTLKGATSGCIAGTGYLRISPEGFVTPCPYMPPAADTSNLKNTRLQEIWQNDRTLRSLRAPGYNGRCKDCEFNDVCGGCRARALATSGDIKGEDPLCGYEPKGRTVNKTSSMQPIWTKAAEERMNNIPAFLRGMVKTGVERYAKKKGVAEITPELMGELRKRAGR